MSLHFLFGNTKFSYLIDKKSKLPYVSKLKPFRKVSRVLTTGCTDKNAILQISNKKILFVSPSFSRSYTFPKEKIKKIQAGGWNYMILTDKGNVYSIGTVNNFEQLPFLDTKKCSAYKPRLVDFFKKKSLFVTDLLLGESTNYFLCSGGKLYASGFNSKGLLSEDIGVSSVMPVLIFDNVSKIYSGSISWGLFLTMKTNEFEKQMQDQNEKTQLFACGFNTYGQLGVGNVENCQKPIKVPIGVPTSDILTIVSSMAHSILVTKKKGLTYSTGSSNFNGLSNSSLTFKIIPRLEDKKIVQVAVAGYSLVLTAQNEIYCWGFQLGDYPIKSQESSTDHYFQSNCSDTNWAIPQKIAINEIKPNNTLSISCGFGICFVDEIRKDPLLDDLQYILNDKNLTDCQIDQIKFHKGLLECRTDIKIDKIIKILSQFKQKKIKNFLKWVYLDKLEDIEGIRHIFKRFKIQFPPENSIEEDLLKLYYDNNSKDFTLIIKPKKKKKKLKFKRKRKFRKRKTDNEEEKGKENNNEIEEENDIIKIHKFILYTRSGLFRGMFSCVDEIINQVHDYSGKSIETLKILIKFLYTEKLEINENLPNKKLILEELQDAIEYYQLNENSSLLSQLNQLKNKITKNVSNKKKKAMKKMKTKKDKKRKKK
ncbi:regulator of chromosome condensation [Anaeramoeba flamelloides]|uniref:Regulator of chromosome condensation n=1 Tax=Anaeramoeba flamelloides TaxID=1746091 RepID=A0AAV8A146_9EUKA|nr:regulator of chromosome condensation [Anaeramoeba flamelloides]